MLQPLTPAAKEQTATPVFFLAASSLHRQFCETNPNRFPPLRQYKTNPISLANLSENPHQGFRLPTPALYPGIGAANSNTASGLRVCSYDFCRRSRSTGKLRDNETGLDFFGARYFSGAQGRFTTPDWSAAPEPVPYADLEDPQTLNQYAYVRNSPLGLADADGHVSAEAVCTDPGGCDPIAKAKQDAQNQAQKAQQ
jgi:RHS repeat-associated protein